MKKFSLLTITDITDETLDAIFDLAVKVKKNPAQYRDVLKGKNLGLIFEKPSTRTRVSFETGMAQLGGNSFYLSPEEIQPGKREPLKDIARTLSRYLDALVLRTFSHATIEEIDRYCTIPVINGLSDRAHPCQALADVLTIMEKRPQWKNARVVYLGDGNNVLNSLMVLCVRKGMHFVYSTPEKYTANPEVVAIARSIAQKTGGSVEGIVSPEDAVKDADVLYTDVWVSMGEKKEQKDVSLYRPYQINRQLLDRAKQDALVMHCLPAYRDHEITDEVMECAQSVVFDQAENRLHVQKAVLLTLLA